MKSDELQNADQTHRIARATNLCRNYHSKSTIRQSNNRYLVTALGSNPGFLGLCMTVFGWWGVETAAGRNVFDEMAGIIPMAIGATGVMLLAVLVILRVILAFRR